MDEQTARTRVGPPERRPQEREPEPARARAAMCESLQRWEGEGGAVLPVAFDRAGAPAG